MTFSIINQEIKQLHLYISNRHIKKKKATYYIGSYKQLFYKLQLGIKKQNHSFITRGQNISNQENYPTLTRALFLAKQYFKNKKHKTTTF